ncbi:uncharacterized mitochondrial protein-like protein [Tanacetum coccineum]
MVPKVVLMRSGLVSLTTAKLVNTAQLRTTMNSARPMTTLSKLAHSTVKWPIHNNTTFKNSNFNQRVNTVKDKNVNTAKPKAVVNAAKPKAVVNSVKGNNVNAVKASACRSKEHVLSSDYEEIDAGYVAFGGNPKGRKTIGKARMETIPSKDYILLPLWTVDLPFSQCSKSSPNDGSKPSSDDKKKVDEDPRKDSENINQEKDDNDNNTNNVNTASTNEVNVVGGKTSIELLDDLNMPALEDIMYVKSAFLYGKIDEEVYVCQPLGFKDPDFPDRRGKIDKTLFIRRDKGDILLVQVYVDDIIFRSIKKSLCIEFEKMIHKKFQMSSTGELIFFLGLQVKQEDVIFISQDNDYARASLDRKSTIGGCQFLRSRLISWQCKKQTLVVNSTTEAEYVAASSCCGHMIWIQNQLLDYREEDPADYPADGGDNDDNESSDDDNDDDDNKRKQDGTSNNNQNQQQPNKRQNTGRAYTAGHREKKHYGRSKPLSDCPELKNQNHENGGTGARGVVHALGGGETNQDHNDMEEDINA